MDRQGFSSNVAIVFAKKTPDNTAGGMKIVSAHPTRIQCIITNKGSIDVFLGSDGTVDANGFYLKAGNSFIDNFWNGDWYAISASTAADLRIVETYESDS